MYLFFRLLFPLLLLRLPSPSGRLQGTSPTPTPTATPRAVWITSPQAGQALQGLVPIQGSTTVRGFVVGRLEFSYAENPTATWFWIADLQDLAAEGAVAEWDTSTISDGNYTLRLTVIRADGSQSAAVVPGLRVRNYTPLETDTPQPTPTSTLTPTLDPNALPTLTPTPLPTPTPTLTPLAPNPADLSPQDILTAVQRGILGIVACFALGGIYLLASNKPRRR